MPHPASIRKGPVHRNAIADPSPKARSRPSFSNRRSHHSDGSQMFGTFARRRRPGRGRATRSRRNVHNKIRLNNMLCNYYHILPIDARLSPTPAREVATQRVRPRAPIRPRRDSQASARRWSAAPARSPRAPAGAQMAREGKNLVLSATNHAMAPLRFGFLRCAVPIRTVRVFSDRLN